MHLGHVGELWRHPVKSMRGDRLAEVAVTAEWGIPGDRGWAVRDEQVGELRGAKQLPGLLQCHARYLTEPHADATPTVEITFPDGSTMRSDDDTIHEALSDLTGRTVTLWPRRPAGDINHYRRARIDEAELRAQLDLGPDEPLPDFSTMPADFLEQSMRYATPPGTYFDALPLSLLAAASIDAVAAAVPEAVVEPRRFRPNIVLVNHADIPSFAEADWVGRNIRVGGVLTHVKMEISRCVMVTLPQGELPHDRPILRWLAQHADNNLGIYLTVLEPGTIREGDPVTLE